VTGGETVKPALRNPTLYGKARCNDGTPFTFFIQKGYESTRQSKEWVIYLKGGVFCDDDAFLCSERARNLTTTAPQADGFLFDWQRQGILSDDPAQNPDFYKANHVYAAYCSSDYWAGITTNRRPSSGDPVKGWYFSGRTNINAMLDVLMSSFGLTDSSDTNVIWAGGSAGSFGAQLTANQAAKHLPNTFAGGRLRLLKDAGWMPDWNDPSHRMGDSTQSDEKCTGMPLRSGAQRSTPRASPPWPTPWIACCRRVGTTSTRVEDGHLHPVERNGLGVHDRAWVRRLDAAGRGGRLGRHGADIDGTRGLVVLELGCHTHHLRRRRRLELRSDGQHAPRGRGPLCQ
jgi:hypothetical protein